MSLLGRVLKTASRGMKGEPRIYGASGLNASFGYRHFLSGSSFDYYREAGPIYDNSVAQSCINWIWRKTPELTWQFEKYAGEGIWNADDPVGAEDILRVLNCPNDAYDGTVLRQNTFLSHLCRGNAFQLIRKNRIGEPIGFWWVYNSQVQARSDKYNEDGRKLVSYYQYTPIGGTPEDKELDEIVHFRWGLDPINPAYGLSPWLGQLREICTDNESATHMAALMRNGASPGVIFIPDLDVMPEEPTKAQQNTMIERWRTHTRDNKGEPFWTPFRMKIEKSGFSPEELVLDKVRSIPAGRIAGAIGLDPMVLAIDTQHQTFSNFDAALKAAITNCLLPLHHMLSEQTSWKILPMFGLDPTQWRLSWNTSRVIGLQEDVNELHKRWRENYKAGVVDRKTAKERIGETADPEDEGTYAKQGSSPEDPEGKQDAKEMNDLD